MDLFSDLKKKQLDMIDADVVYYSQFFKAHEADAFFSHLLGSIKWQQDDITVFGKTHKQPRLTALYANNEKPYRYSNIIMYPHLFNEELRDIKSKIEAEAKVKFTSCLLNLYRNGTDSNGWHADDEKALGKNPIIASVSLGAERLFHFKHKEDKSLKEKMVLHHGSLLIMKGETQHHWLHQIPKTRRPIGKRINLTFRIIA